MAMPSGVPRRPVVLIILDGFGINPSKRHNAIELAKTPNLDRYFSSFPHTTLQASGLGVGLPDCLMGNSEVGHMFLGAVSIIRQDIVHISAAIANNYSVVLTADHGNCEETVDAITGLPHTQHTLYPVPCMIVDKSAWQLSCSGGLSNIAPTVLQLMGLQKPAAMTSGSLLIREIAFATPEEVIGSAA
jgi:bisphosphoglycerate-independent phosphoglycerate mutase (AlkP superfamily)